MRKVLVTGGCGYIGSHVTRAFIENGDKVFVVDRVERKHTLVNVDGFCISDFVDCLDAITAYRPDVIVHCAGTSLVGPSVLNPAEYYDNNVVKTIKLLDHLREHNLKPTILFSSSASVYGEPELLPIPESATIKPISPYGNTKAMTEMMLKDYWVAYGIPSVCFRYFNAAGAIPATTDLGQETGATHIVAQVLAAHFENRKFAVYGNNFPTKDGTCIRDYVHVYDIARAHVDAVNGLPPGAHRFNLGSKSGISNQEIVDYVSNKYGLVGVDYVDPRPGDPAVLVADSTAVNQAIGWQPKFSSIDTIIDTAWAWHKKQYLGD